ncbi:MAG: hypothetical protein K6E29_05120 [Cyanobacteria bacterium RUI128]|nr:hypothetical protein [Cyanobacteria bacterium RUI128]
MKKEKIFDKWFAENYGKLQAKCLITNLFGELMFNYQQDIFHDAYLTTRQKVSDDESTFEIVFRATFRQLSKKAYRDSQKEVSPSSLFWSFLTFLDDEEETNNKDKVQALADKVKAYAKKTFSKDEFTLLEMYFKYSLNLTEIGNMYGCGAPSIYKRLTKMQGILFNRFMDEFKAL